MSEITIHDIQQHPDEFLRRIESGETIVLIREGRPVAEVRPVSSRSSELRPIGLCAGEFTVPADFDAPLPEEVLAAFER